MGVNCYREEHRRRREWERRQRRAQRGIFWRTFLFCFLLVLFVVYGVDLIEFIAGIPGSFT